MSNVVSWGRPMFERFKKAYKTAVAEKEISFWFDGNEFDVGYAKYLIEFLKERLQ